MPISPTLHFLFSLLSNGVTDGGIPDNRQADLGRVPRFRLGERRLNLSQSCHLLWLPIRRIPGKSRLCFTGAEWPLKT